MSKSSEDPFYAVRDNVSTQVERVKIKNEKFKSLMKKVDTSTDADFKELRKSAFLIILWNIDYCFIACHCLALIKDIRQAEKDLKGLRGAVETVRWILSTNPKISLSNIKMLFIWKVEKNRQKFAHVKDTELALRKKFVDDTQTILNGSFYIKMIE